MTKLNGIKILFSLLIISLSACTTVKDLSYEDSGERLPALSLSAQLTESMHVELEHAALQGERRDVTVEADERIHLDDLRIYGPRELSSDYELQHSKLGLRVDLLQRESVQLRTGFGFSQTRLDLSFSEEEGRRGFETDSPGAYGHFELRLPLGKHFALSGKVGASKFFDADSGYLIDQGLRLSAGLGPNLEIYSGWFNWLYENEDFWSEIDVETQGLVYGMHFAF